MYSMNLYGEATMIEIQSLLGIGYTPIDSEYNISLEYSINIDYTFGLAFSRALGTTFTYLSGCSAIFRSNIKLNTQFSQEGDLKQTLNRE